MPLAKLTLRESSFVMACPSLITESVCQELELQNVGAVPLAPLHPPFFSCG
jgi:hypothetical protein